MIVLGIDTAIRCTGYGAVDFRSLNDIRILDCGVISNSAKLPHSECLRRLAGGVRQLILQFKPETLSMEDAFCSKNIKTAMILSLARGAVITIAAEAAVPVYVYSPKTAKRAATGNGSASKEQVAALISSMLGINIKDIPLDSTDALALAMCHGQVLIRPELKDLLPKPV